MTSEFKTQQVEDGIQAAGSSSIGPFSSSGEISLCLEANISPSIRVEYRVSQNEIKYVFVKDGVIEDNEAEHIQSMGNPPSWAEKLLCIITPHEKCDAILGDFSEKYQKHIKKYGVKRARYMYSSQVIRSAGPLLWVAIKRLALVLVGWKLTGP